VFTWGDGSRYEGEFVHNNIHGKGVYKWGDDRQYTGDWKDNKMDGQGIFTWIDGRKYNIQQKVSRRLPRRQEARQRRVRLA
jgi:hypothetical protein